MFSDQDELNEKIYELNRIAMKEMKKCTGLLTFKEQAIQVKNTRTHARTFVCMHVRLFLLLTNGFDIIFLFESGIPFLLHVLNHFAEVDDYFKYWQITNIYDYFHFLLLFH